MPKSHYIECPTCRTLMEVAADSGEILNKRTASEQEKKGGDKMASAIKKLAAAKEKRKNLFSVKKEEMNDLKKKLSSDFKKELDKAKKEGPGEKPLRPFDLD